MKTKLYVLTGFLGSGKTTLLQTILQEMTRQKKTVGIIQNEFGKLNIDGEILRNDDVKMVEISRGSIFCSCLKLSFVQALADMAANDFDTLFIESSGLGDPSNVGEILEASTILSGKTFDFGGVICMIDALHFLDDLNDLETVDRQLKHCHMAVLTKTDLVSEEQLILVKEKIREINPVCLMNTCINGQMDLSFLSEDLLVYHWAEDEETTNSEETKPKTLFLNFESVIEEEKLTRFLKELSGDLYRAKGFFHLKEKGWCQVDLVGDKIDIKSGEEKELSQLVLISKIGPAVIRKIMPAWESICQLPMKLKN